MSTSLRSWFSCCFGCIAVEDLQNASGPVCFPVVSFILCSIALDLVTTLLLAQLCYVKCLLMSGMVSTCLVITKDAVLLSFVSIVANGFIEGCLFEKCVNRWDIKALRGVVQSNDISVYHTISQHYTQTATHFNVNCHVYLLKDIHKDTFRISIICFVKDSNRYQFSNATTQLQFSNWRGVSLL